VASPLRDEASQLKHRQAVHLLLAHNPNYFGNLPELDIPPVIELTNDTYFEELTRVGWGTDPDVLAATVEVKRAVGYGDDSVEWVRFYLSYDGGGSWEDAGLASFTARDLTGPVSHTVAHPVPERHRGRTGAGGRPLVRTVLSWQITPPPGHPGWQPVWGNVVDRDVAPRPVPEERGASRRRYRPPWRPYGDGGAGTPVTDASVPRHLAPDGRWPRCDWVPDRGYAAAVL
jgi:hypothetical protein